MYVPINVDKCSAANKEAPWLQVQTLDQLKSRKPKEIHDFPYAACCRCRLVRLGFNQPPVYAVNCCCTDCVAAAHYMDTKAATSHHHNISFQERGNPKASRVAAFPPSSVTIIPKLELWTPT